MKHRQRDRIMAIMRTLKCPKCGGRIEYNGNYYCQFWVYPWPGGTGACDWALPHPQETYADRLISWKLLGYWERDYNFTPDDLVFTRPKKS